MKKINIASTLAVAALTFSSIAASAQSVDPLIGTWNLKGQPPAFIAVMTFNAGGTTVEFDTAGTNSSASPGESIVLGKWSKTGTSTYKFKEENYIYDSSGNLAYISIGTCTITLASNHNQFSGKCTGNIYTCSVTTCPGTLVSSGSLTITGTRF